MKVTIILILLAIFTIDHNAYRREGICTHYGRGYHLIRSGASGIKVDADLPLAASRDIPYGTIVEVENIDNSSRCKDNKMRVMIFDLGPEAEPEKRMFDMMPQGGFYSYKGKPGIAEKGRGGVKVKVTVVDMTHTCSPERLGDDMGQTKTEWWCLGRYYGKNTLDGYFMTKEDIWWEPWFEKNKECYEEN